MLDQRIGCNIRTMKCPHCITAFHEAWSILSLIADKDGHWHARYLVCPECKRAVITLQMLDLRSPGLTKNFFLAYPKSTVRPPTPTAVTCEFSSDYKEACLVFPDSPKASAALSRRLLQHLIREKAGIRRKDLATEIQDLIDSGTLPSYLSEAIDGVRNIGNFAAHPIKSQNTGELVDVEPGEAEWLLDTIEGMFDFYFVQPELLREKRAALDAKLKEAGKQPMK